MESLGWVFPFLLLFVLNVHTHLIDKRFCADNDTLHLIREITDCAFEHIKDVVRFLKKLDQAPASQSIAVRAYMNNLIPSMQGEQPGERAIQSMLYRFNGEANPKQAPLRGLVSLARYIPEQDYYDKYQMKFYCSETFLVYDPVRGVTIDYSEYPYVEHMFKKPPPLCDNTQAHTYHRDAISPVTGRKRYHDIIVLCPWILERHLPIPTTTESESYYEIFEKGLDSLPKLAEEDGEPKIALFDHVAYWFWLPHLVLHELMHTAAAGALTHSKLQTSGGVIDANGWQLCQMLFTNPQTITNDQGPEFNPDTYSFLVIGIKIIMKGYNIDSSGWISVPGNEKSG